MRPPTEEGLLLVLTSCSNRLVEGPGGLPRLEREVVLHELNQRFIQSIRNRKAMRDKLLKKARTLVARNDKEIRALPVADSPQAKSWVRLKNAEAESESD